MASNLVLEVRQGLTAVVNKLISVFSTDDVISEVMSLRHYTTSPYKDQMYATLKEVGVFKLDYFSEILLMVNDLTIEKARLYGLVDENGNYILKGRYTIPIRDIGGNVTALVGWYPDVKKYVTTPTYGFSKEGQFFNIECFEKSFSGNYPKYVDESGVVLESKGLVYLVEGIFDTLSLRSLGFPVLGNMGLEMSLVKTEILSRFNKVIAIPDNDKSGMSTNKYLNRISGKGKGFEWLIKNEHVIVQLPKGVKDSDDFIKEFVCMDDLLRCQRCSYKVSLTED